MEIAYFSIPHYLILLNVPLPFDIYINSSSLESRERFVRIVQQGDFVTQEQINVFHAKYRTLYLLESNRDAFLQSLSQLPGQNKQEKANFIKDSAVRYLSRIFETPPSTEVLGQTLASSREVVESFVDLVVGNDLDSIKSLLGNLGSHDFYTYDHSVNVSVYSIMILQALKPNAKRLELVHAGMSGLFHDLGKVKIPVAILNKPDKLSPEELQLIHKHPEYGSELLTQPGLVIPSGIDTESVRCSILGHHENFDGSGYPFKLKGEEIHFLGRVTAVADFFDAITTKRAYAPALSPEEAIALMKRSEGKKLDPGIFQCFCQQTEAFRRAPMANRELPSSFDPCMPHARFPFQDLVLRPKDPSTPQVKPSETPKGAGKVRFIVDAERRAAKTGLVKKRAS